MQKDKEQKKDNDQNKDNGLAIPNDVNTQEKLKEWLNTVASEYRPKAKVVHIKESSHFEKDMVMILKIGDKKPINKLEKMTNKEKREKFVESLRSNERNFLKNSKILAIPINKRLKWAVIDKMPEDFWSDLINQNDP